MKKYIFILIFLICSNYSYGLDVGDYGRISGNNVIVREDSSTRGEYVGKLDKNNSVDILEVGPESTIGKWGKHRWYKIRCHDNKISGWVFGAFVKELISTPDFIPSPCEIITDNVMMRKSDTIESVIVKKLKMGDRGFALMEGKSATIGRWGTNNWYKIILDNGKKVGWVFGPFLKLTYERKKKDNTIIEKNGDRLKEKPDIEYEIY